MLERLGSITESKEHDGGFIKAKGGNECGLPLVLLMDLDVVIPPSNIEFGKQSGVFHVIDQLRGEGKWISVVNGVTIQVSIVLAWSKGSIFL